MPYPKESSKMGIDYKKGGKLVVFMPEATNALNYQ